MGITEIGVWDRGGDGHHTLSRSRNLVFLIFSLGLFATPSSHDRTLLTVTMCCSSGVFTRIVSRVPGGTATSLRIGELKREYKVGSPTSQFNGGPQMTTKM